MSDKPTKTTDVLAEGGATASMDTLTPKTLSNGPATNTGSAIANLENEINVAELKLPTLEKALAVARENVGAANKSCDAGFDRIRSGELDREGYAALLEAVKTAENAAKLAQANLDQVNATIGKRQNQIAKLRKPSDEQVASAKKLAGERLTSALKPARDAIATVAKETGVTVTAPISGTVPANWFAPELMVASASWTVKDGVTTVKLVGPLPGGGGGGRANKYRDVADGSEGDAEHFARLYNPDSAAKIGEAKTAGKSASFDHIAKNLVTAGKITQV